MLTRRLSGKFYLSSISRSPPCSWSSGSWRTKRRRMNLVDYLSRFNPSLTPRSSLVCALLPPGFFLRSPTSRRRKRKIFPPLSLIDSTCGSRHVDLLPPALPSLVRFPFVLHALFLLQVFSLTLSLLHITSISSAPFFCFVAQSESLRGYVSPPAARSLSIVGRPETDSLSNDLPLNHNPLDFPPNSTFNLHTSTMSAKDVSSIPELCRERKVNSAELTLH